MAPQSLAYPRRTRDTDEQGPELLNWARNSALAPRSAVRAPATVEELRSLVAATDAAGNKVRVVGSRMSAGRMLALASEGDTLLDLRHLSGLVATDATSATFGGATPLQEVYDVLAARGLTLPSSPGVIASQTLAGALSTGTHGQGLRQSSIADAALGVQMVLADGSLLDLTPDHPWFPAVQLGLGTLGVVTQVTLRTEPLTVWTCRKDAVSAETLQHDLPRWNRENALSKAWWFPEEDLVHLWAAREADDDEVRRHREHGGGLLVHERSSDAMNAAVDTTLGHMRRDTGEADEGKPLRTVARFKDFTDVTGDVYQVFMRGIATPQINVEIGVPLERAGQVVEKIKAWHAETRPHLHYPIILRCTGPSASWLSPSHARETCFFGFVVYYSEDGSLSEEGTDFLRAVERLLAAEGGRPHWGKYFDASLYDWRSLYPRWEDFRAVRAALDPRRTFGNAFTAALLDGER